LTIVSDLRDSLAIGRRQETAVDMTVSPAFGRDYKSKAAALADWAAGKDFLIEGVGRWAGKPINKAQADADGIQVKIRFNGLRSVVAVPVCGDCGCAK
jgi:hypothetical protein